MKNPRIVKGVHELVRLIRLAADENKIPKDEYCESRKNESSFYSSMVGSRDRSFYGCSGINEFENNLKNIKISERITEAYTNKKTYGTDQKLMESVSGEFNSVEKYLSGQPECMAEFEDKEANSFLTVLVETSVSSNITKSEFEERAIEVIKGVSVMEGSGIRCRLEIHFSNTKNEDQKHNNWKWVVKDFEDEYLKNMHGYILSYIDSYRVAGFTYWALFNNRIGFGLAGSIRDEDFPKKSPYIYVSYKKDSPKKIREKFMGKL